MKSFVLFKQRHVYSCNGSLNCSPRYRQINTGIIIIIIIIIIIKSNPYAGLERPLRFQEVKAPRFLDSRHMKVVRLSAIRTGRVYPPRKYS
jgi:hypothetical protein